MKRFLTYAAALLIALPCLFSCEETKPEDEYANWKNRNIQYIDGIADKCLTFKNVTVQNAQPGQMFRLLSFKLDSAEGKTWSNQDYVYCEVMSRGTGTESPLFTDSVRINYRARLMPTPNYPEGRIMDQSFKTDTFDPTVNIPSSFTVSGLIDGVSTALMQMHEGDTWRLYIPYSLGYGSSNKTDIPAYSALVFEINYVCNSRKGTDLPPR